MIAEEPDNLLSDTTLPFNTVHLRLILFKYHISFLALESDTLKTISTFM